MNDTNNSSNGLDVESESSSTSGVVVSPTLLSTSGSSLNQQQQQQQQSNTFVPHPTLVQISQILQQSIEMKLCSSIETHIVVWDTLMHNVETNPDVIALTISLLMTKYVQLVSMPEKRNTPLISLLISILSKNISPVSSITSSGSSIPTTSSSSSTSQQQQQQTTDIVVSTVDDMEEVEVDEDDVDDDDDKLVQQTSSININGSSQAIPQQQSLIVDNQQSSSTPTQQSTPSLVAANATSPVSASTTPTTSTTTTTTTTTTPLSPTLASSPEEQREIDHMKSTIITTLYYIALFNNFNSNNPTLRFMLTRYTDHFDKSRDTTDLLKILSPGYKDSSEYIFYLIDRCSDFTTDTQANKNIARSCWFNSCITDMFQQANKHKQIFENLLLFLKHPLLLEKRMLFFLQMLKHYLLVAPLISPSALAASLSIVNTYYLWPRPFCDLAKEILEILSIEYQCPGSFIRTMLSHEVPSVMGANNEPVTHARPAAAHNNSPSPSSPLFSSMSLNDRPTIHMLVDRYNADALSIQDIFEHYTKNTNPSVVQLQANDITNIYYRIMGFDNDALGLEYLSPSDIGNIHSRIIDLLNKTMYLEIEDCKATRIRELASIREDIVKISTKGAPFKHVPQTLILPNLHYSFSSLYRISIKNKKPDELATQYCFPVYRKTTNLLTNMLTHYQTADWKQPIKICIVGNDASIHHVVGSYVYLKYHSPDLFTDLDLQFFLIPAGPTSKFAEFLATFDNWYNRQVAGIVNSMYDIMPAFKPTSISQPDQTAVLESLANIKEERKSILFDNTKKEVAQIEEPAVPTSRTPSSIVLSELQYLFREASYKLNIPLMKCEGWNEDVYHTIPFFHRAEIGLNAYFQGTGEAALIDSSLANRMNKYVPANVTAKIGIVNPLGTQIQQLTLDSKTYFELSIVNQMPKFNKTSQVTPTHSTSPPSSNNNNNNSNTNGNSNSNNSNNKTKETTTTASLPPSMDVYLTEFDAKKKRAKNDEPINFTSNSIEIECAKDEKKKPFDVMLDGQLCGPYTKIRITFCNVSDEVIQMPMMTYLPYY
ncbi:hypothetical protein SAMD00019534_008420 [Acytostelium subglobosum LB1]|uniref:hypothetical protein n=1 Tax=Acytostelium subglobosum LB1 TaxID=1410327 RepID=UPI0006447D56|nr:hypothetical protein SAMD00019534_008420 [Acytostelium subglobosum LB1]GAM17667.1 hypothetical protein SAMD00019534_008420 [Acytostelium subglobosum LB1]|eukprot:XP_012758263.1 hypothetical protein SAMD00019534_008420 [Acytostelium subglobosum LB1]